MKQAASGNPQHSAGELSVVVCEDLDEWHVGGRLKKQGVYI